MTTQDLRIDADALLARLTELGRIGATGDGGCCRLALTDADRAGRDLVRRWMGESGLQVQVWEEAVLRKENLDPVQGLVVLARKTAAA